MNNYDPTQVLNYFTKAVDTTYQSVSQVDVNLSSKSRKFGEHPRDRKNIAFRAIPSQAH